MMQQSWEVGRSGGMNRGVEVCSVMFLVISIGYCSTIWLDLPRRRFSVGLKLDLIAHRKLLTVIVICVWIFFPPRINFFTSALIVRQFWHGTVGGSPEIRTDWTGDHRIGEHPFCVWIISPSQTQLLACSFKYLSVLTWHSSGCPEIKVTRIGKLPFCLFGWSAPSQTQLPL